MEKKTIFWTSFITVILTLTLVSYFTDYFKSEGSEIGYFFKCLGLVTTLLFVPATLVFRLLFGKIKSDNSDYYFLFALAIVAIFFVIINEIILYFYKTESYVTRRLIMIISLITAIFFTKNFLNGVFYKKKDNDLM